jgi:hypothetical protein
MRTIWKYRVPGQSHFTLALPKGAQVLSAALQHNDPHIWALVDAEAPPEARKFCCLGTGWKIDETNLKFIGTVLLEGGTFVFHLFEDVSA